MGHERVGALPRSKQWVDVIESIVQAVSDEPDVSELARLTINNVRRQIAHVPQDAGVQEALRFLVALSLSASPESQSFDLDPFVINLESNPSPLSLARELGERIESNRQSNEYGELARRAAADTIAIWTRNESRQMPLFGQRKEAADVWVRASDGGGFSEVSRLFFSKFVERYLNYFIAREASNRLHSTSQRELLHVRLRDHVDVVSRHAFETAQITQSFAAGWFNRNARQGMPSPDQIERFIAISIGKIREELLRQGNGQ